MKVGDKVIIVQNLDEAPEIDSWIGERATIVEAGRYSQVYKIGLFLVECGNRSNERYWFWSEELAFDYSEDTKALVQAIIKELEREFNSKELSEEEAMVLDERIAIVLTMCKYFLK